MKEIQEQPTEFIIPADLLQNIVDYLLEQKMRNVVGLVNAIQENVKPVEEAEPMKKVK